MSAADFHWTGGGDHCHQKRCDSKCGREVSRRPPQTHGNTRAPQLISMFLIPSVYFIVELGLGIFLFRSSDRCDYKRLRLWSTVTVTLVLVGIVYFVTEILKSEKFGDIIILHVLNLAFTIYSIWAVHCLMEEIKTRAVHHTVPYCTPTTDNYEYNYNYDRDRTTSTTSANGFYKV